MDIKTNEKIRVRLESFNHHLLTLSCQKIAELIQSYNINTYSIITSKLFNQLAT